MRKRVVGSRPLVSLATSLLGGDAGPFARITGGNVEKASRSLPSRPRLEPPRNHQSSEHRQEFAGRVKKANSFVQIGSSPAFLFRMPIALLHVSQCGQARLIWRIPMLRPQLLQSCSFAVCLELWLY